MYEYIFMYYFLVTYQIALLLLLYSNMMYEIVWKNTYKIILSNDSISPSLLLSTGIPSLHISCPYLKTRRKCL